MRILYLDNEPSWRGGQQQLLDLMTGLAGRGHRLWLAAPAGSPLSRRAAGTGIPVFDLSQRLETSPAAVARISRLVATSDSQLVHCNTPRSLLAAGLVVRWRQRTLVASRRVAFPLRSRLSVLKYNLARRTIAVSDAIREQLIADGLHDSRIVRIYDGVDIESFDALPAAELNWPGDGPVVAVVAALTAEKGHRTLFEAAADLHSAGRRARWLVVGDGPLRQTLEKLAGEKGLGDAVRFTGFREDSRALLKSADIFCLPSHSEGLSSAVLDAMACGLPVAASRAGGLAELISDGETGLLSEPGDAAHLNSNLARLFEDAALRRRLGESGRLRVGSQFTLRQTVEATEALYRQLLADTAIR